MSKIRKRKRRPECHGICYYLSQSAPILVLLLVGTTSSLPTHPDTALLEWMGIKKYDITTIVKKSFADDEPFLEYSIFKGRSALRNLLSHSLLFSEDDEYFSLSKARRALVLLCAGHGDASHEVILGVTPDCVDEAEYAATHPGQTSWNDDHPLQDVDDWVHSLLHRMEGSTVGEGGHSGFENAKYWAAGGPKVYGRLGCGPSWKRALCQLARMRTPISVARGVVVATDEDASHRILAGGDKLPRLVTVAKGSWNPIRYIELCNECRESDTALRRELDWLHRVEVWLLFWYEESDDDEISAEALESICREII
jgi:hypothetical protein